MKCATVAPRRGPSLDLLAPRELVEFRQSLCAGDCRGCRAELFERREREAELEQCRLVVSKSGVGVREQYPRMRLFIAKWPPGGPSRPPGPRQSAKSELKARTRGTRRYASSATSTS